MQFVLQNCEKLELKVLIGQKQPSKACTINKQRLIVLFTSDVRYKKYKRLVYTPPDLWARFCKHKKSSTIFCVTCLATLLQNELYGDVAQFTTHIKPVLQQIRLLTGFNEVVKRATSLFNSFCSNVAKQVARFLLPVFPYL